MRLERLIAQDEELLSQLDAALADTDGMRDSQELERIGSEREALQSQLDERYRQWMDTEG